MQTAEHRDGSREREGRRRGRLPVLSMVLVCLVGVYFASRLVHYLRTGKERRQGEAFREALDYIERNYVNEVERDDLFRAAMRGMVAGLGDRWSVYLDPDEATRERETIAGMLVGIGVTIYGSEIVGVNERGPSAAAGIEAGDLITRIDGEPVDELSGAEIAARLRGEAGTEVALELRRPGVEEPIEVTITREVVEIVNVAYEMATDRIGHLTINAFDADCAAEVEEALEAMLAEGAEAFILDLRKNHGGLLSAAEKVADMFLTGGLIYEVETRLKDSTVVHEASAETMVEPGVPLAVLVGGVTASAAEILAGALKANRRARLIGVATLGKGAVVDVHALPDGSALFLTVGYYRLADGQVVEGKGIEPDDALSYPLPEPPPEAEGSPAALRRWLAEQRRKADEFVRQQAVDYLEEMLASEGGDG